MMKINLKENKGVTLIVLIITIILMGIVAAVSLTQGADLLKQTEVESLITNMITIKAKSKVIAEEVNAKVWDIKDAEEKKQKRKELYETNYKMQQVELTDAQTQNLDSSVGTNYEAYLITSETLEYMSLKDINAERRFIVVYNIDDYTKLDVVYEYGIDYEGVYYYTLSHFLKDAGE